MDKLSLDEKKRLWAMMPSLLEQPAFELNIIGLYVLKVLGASYEQLNDHVQKYVPKPVGEPIKNALSYIAKPVEIHQETEINTEEEPDNRFEEY